MASRGLLIRSHYQCSTEKVSFSHKPTSSKSSRCPSFIVHVLVGQRLLHRCWSLSSPPELSLNTASFAKSTAMLGSAEDNTALSRALSQLAEVEDKMEQLHQEQAANDTFSFAELIADYVRLLGAVRVPRKSPTLC